MILKSPMKLQNLSVLKMYPDVLGEKIRANYRLIGTDITSEDFWHMTMQEPALFMNLENHQTLVVENQVDTKNALKLELANQLLNRILLINSPHFTYQDEVFVTSILQKMGILNVEEFIQQVRRHMEHNALFTGLFRQYVQYHLERSHRIGALKKEDHLERYLHNEILKRLMTADCNNIMYIYHNQINSKTSSESVRNAAWMEQADAIMLTQYREKLMDWKVPVHWQEYMNYEIKPLGKEELTKRRILQRMTAAVLENIIQKISYEQQRNNHNHRIWKDYTSVFYQSAADVFKRFGDFQSRKVLDVRQYAVYEQGMSELVQDERKLIQMLQSFEWNQKTENYAVSNINQNSSQDDTVFEMVMRSLWENCHLQKLLAGRMQIEERFAYQIEQQNMDFETYLINEAAYMNERKELQESSELFLTMLQNVNDMNEETPANRLDWMLDQRTDTYRDMPVEYEQMTPTVISKAASFLQNTMMMEDYDNQPISQRNQSHQTHQSSQQEQKKQSRQTHQDSQQEQDEQSRQTNQGSQQEQKEQSRRMYHNILQEQTNKYEYENTPQQSNSNNSYDYMQTFLNKYKDFASDQSVPLMENAELLEQVNQHNLYMKTLLESKEAAGQSTCKPIRVDKEKARRDALRALENSQAVLNEVYHNAEAVKMEIPGEIERILSIIDEPARMFYERLLGYRKEETVLHHQPRGYGEEADILYNSIHDEEADISHSSIHDENTGILYRSIRNEEADNLYRSIQNENTDTSYNSSSSEKTDISYHPIHDENASIFYNSNHNESANAAHHHTMNDMSIRSAAIYAILKQIRETENSLYQEIISKQNPVLYEYPVSEPYNRALADGAKGIANQIAVHTADRKAQSFQETAHIELVHKKEEAVSEERIQYVAEQILQSSREQNIKQSQSIQAQIRQEQAEQGQAVQKQFQDIGQEQIAQLVSQNLKTQVHTISDRVYLELERRLKNEQRRRGY